MRRATFAPGRMKLLGSGQALPGPAIPNAELLASIERACGTRTSAKAARIVARLGIRARHFSRQPDAIRSGARSGMSAPELCRDALREASEECGLETSMVDYLIGHTTSPHTLLPPNVAWVADAIRYDGPYMELRQACTGFAAAAQIATAMLTSRAAERIAVVGSEVGSPHSELSAAFMNTEQLVNFVQMGDGAAAVVLGRDDGSESQIVSELFVGQIGLDREPGISIERGGSREPTIADGLTYFRHRADDVRGRGRALIEAGIDALTARGHCLDDFDWLIPHQANGRIADLMAQATGVQRDKIHVTADRLGNLGSAAIWSALHELRCSGKLARGHRVLVLGAEASKYLYGGFVYQH